MPNRAEIPKEVDKTLRSQAASPAAPAVAPKDDNAD